MVTLVIAIAFLCFEMNDAQRGVLAFIAALVVILVAWEINVHWKSSTGEPGTLLQRTQVRMKSLVGFFKPKDAKQVRTDNNI